MSVARLTKIVSTCLILAACHSRDYQPTDGVGETSRPGIGVQTKAGKMLTQGKWCQKSKTDSAGVMRLQMFDFGKNGTFRRSLNVINRDATMTKERVEKGNWAIVDGQLLFMLDGNTLKMNVAEYTRNEDGASCLKITADGDAVEGDVPLCPCDN